MSNTVDLTNYDAIADVYTNKVENDLSYNNLYERPYWLSVFENFSGRNVVDLGAGTGFYSFYALEQQAKVTAVDASQKMLNFIAENDQDNKITRFRADLKDGLPFLETDSQDVIICSLVLHYVENWDSVIADFYRVLKKGGKLYVSTHHPFADYLFLHKESYFAKYLLDDTWNTKDVPFKVHYFTRSLTDLLKPFLNSSFKIKAIEEPQPTTKCLELAPKTYQKLLEKPAFIFLTLEK